MLSRCLLSALARPMPEAEGEQAEIRRAAPEGGDVFMVKGGGIARRLLRAGVPLLPLRPTGAPATPAQHVALCRKTIAVPEHRARQGHTPKLSMVVVK